MLGALLAWMPLAWCPSAFALNPALDISQYAHTSWKLREGFSRGRITSIAQTPDGYLWLGTDLGLLRFDGVRPVPWQPPADQPLPSNTILGLLAGRDGTLWIGTSKGLASWNGNRLTQYPEVARQLIFTLLEDRDGAVWVGTNAVPNAGKLCVIRNGSVQCYGEDGRFGNNVSYVYEDRKGNLWAVAATGLWRWKPDPPEFFQMPHESTTKENLAEDADGTLLIGAYGGIRRLVDGKFQVAYPLQGSLRRFNVGRVFRDRDGSLWLGTPEQGLMHVHEGRVDLFSSSQGLSGDNVTTFFEDREGNIWVATTNGLDRFHELAVSTLSVSPSMSETSYAVLPVRDGSVLVATPSGVNRWKDGQYTAYIKRTVQSKYNSNVPYSLFQDARGRIWGVTPREFGYLENNRFIPIRGIPGGIARSIAEDTEGNLWVANQNLGLLQLRGSKVVRQLRWDRLGHRDFASAMAFDPLRGGLWLGFYEGGVSYFKDGQVLATYGPADGLGDGLVGDFRFDLDGTVWIATAGGLSRLKNDRIATLTSRNGLPCDEVQWLREDADHFFWVYTACGLARLARTELDAWDSDPQRTIRATVFDMSDGVRGRSYPIGFSPPVAQIPDGRLWFADAEGVSIIDPRHLPFNRLPPLVHVEGIIADRTTYSAAVAADGQVRLPALVRDLEIDYTALSLAAPEKVLFHYKLENWDRDWQEVGTRRRAFYNNLPPGNYRFRVMACNNSGVWNETGTFLDFSIAPAYYQTTWFRLSFAAAFIVLLTTLYQLRLRQVARHVQGRMEARLEERERIARDLHDTLLQSVQGLILKIHAVARQMRQDEPTRDSLEKTLDQADEVLAEGRDRVRNLRTNPIPLGGLPAAFQQVAEETFQGSDAILQTVVEGHVLELHPVVREEAYSIGREALVNAFTHSNGKHIEVEIIYDPRQFRLRVRDDGHGVDPKILEKGGRADHWGLQGMRERAQKIGAQLKLWSGAETGTEVELIVPGATAYKAAGDQAKPSWLSRTFRR